MLHLQGIPQVRTPTADRAVLVDRAAQEDRVDRVDRAGRVVQVVTTVDRPVLLEISGNRVAVVVRGGKLIVRRPNGPVSSCRSQL